MTLGDLNKRARSQTHLGYCRHAGDDFAKYEIWMPVGLGFVVGIRPGLGLGGYILYIYWNLHFYLFYLFSWNLLIYLLNLFLMKIRPGYPNLLIQLNPNPHKIMKEMLSKSPTQGQKESTSPLVSVIEPLPPKGPVIYGCDMYCLRDAGIASCWNAHYLVFWNRNLLHRGWKIWDVWKKTNPRVIWRAFPCWCVSFGGYWA